MTYEQGRDIWREQLSALNKLAADLPPGRVVNPMAAHCLAVLLGTVETVDGARLLLHSSPKVTAYFLEQMNATAEIFETSEEVRQNVEFESFGNLLFGLVSMVGTVSLGRLLQMQQAAGEDSAATE